jgi:hypothetical protein
MDPMFDKSPRVTKSGKVNRQDVNVLKKNIQRRVGDHTRPNLPEQGVAEGWFSRSKAKPGVDDAGRELMKQDRESHTDMDDYSWQIGWIYADGSNDVKAAYSDAYYDNPTIPSPPEPRSFKLGFDARRKQGVAEAETDYSKRRQRERDVDAGKPVPKQRPSKMTDYQKRRAQQKREMELGESTNYWTKLQNERNNRLNTLVNELNESIKDIK